MAGCAKSDHSVQPEKSAGISFKAVASDTRTAYTDGANAIATEWIERDRVGIFALNGGSPLKGNVGYEAGASGSTTDFYPATNDYIAWADETSAHDFFACCPYDASAGTDPTAVNVSLPDVQTQNDKTPAHLAGYDFMYASRTGLTKAAGQVDLSFDHLFSILKVELTSDLRGEIEAVIFRCTDSSEPVSFTDAKVNLGTGAVNLAGAATSNEIRLDCPGKVVFPTKSTYCYLMISPGHANKQFEIVVVVGGVGQVVATKNVPTSGIPAGVMAEVSGVVTINPAYERLDVDLSATGTANTYIVNRAAEFYKFNASVKGNGTARTYTVGGLTYDAASLAIAPVKAIVLWYNCMQTNGSPWIDAEPVEISSVELNSSGYVTFGTPDTFVNGHAVIAVLDANVDYSTITVDNNGSLTNANILWSWDIWAVDGYNPDAAIISVGGFTIMDRNLGALHNGSLIDKNNDTFAGPNADKAASAVGNFYQWGRKDPFPHFAGYYYYNGHAAGLEFTPTYTPVTALQKDGQGTADPKADHQIFAGQSAAASNNLPADYSSLTASVAKATLNPHRFLDGSGNDYHWVSNTPAKQWRGLWGSPLDAINNNTAGTGALKSIYDPCPVGWQLWTNAAVKAIVDQWGATAALATNAYGITMNGYFFPFNGGAMNPGGGLTNYINPLAQGGPSLVGYMTSVSNTYYTVNNGWMSGFQWGVSRYSATSTYDPSTLSVTSTLSTNGAHAHGRRAGNVRCMKE
ncbi:hypothetical protein FACS1894159_10360 [Bacteroidia bacterium]|nr:hypothetical protein FACS1894159_10360 [Bacteroidia bacterium]